DEALQKEKKTDGRPVAVLGVEVLSGISKLVQGKPEACWKKLDEVVARSKKEGTGQRFGTPGFKARLMTREGDAAAAEKIVRAQEKAGDAKGAAATREAFFRVPRRGIEYVYLWKKLGGRPAARVAAKPEGE